MLMCMCGMCLCLCACVRVCTSPCIEIVVPQPNSQPGKTISPLCQGQRIESRCLFLSCFVERSSGEKENVQVLDR